MSQPQHALPGSTATQPRPITRQRHTGRHARRRMRPGQLQDLAAAALLIALAVGAMYIAVLEAMAGNWRSVGTSGLAVAMLYGSAVVLLIRVANPHGQDQEDD